MQGTGTSPRWP
jgi:hypothetical protein